MQSLEERFWAKVSKAEGDGCWLWTASITESGYGKIRVAGRGLRVHRLAWTLANGAIPDGQHVLHNCDVRNCVRPSHLFLGTHADNMYDMKAKGRVPKGDQSAARKYPERLARGDRNGRVVVSDADVGACRFVHAMYGVSGTDLATAVGGSVRAMNNILSCKSRPPKQA